MASRFSISSPITASRARVSRRLSPASTRMRVRPAAMKVLLPELLLASTQILTIVPPAFSACRVTAMRRRCPAPRLFHRSCHQTGKARLQPRHVKRIVRAAIPVKAAQPVSVQNQEAIALDLHLARGVFKRTGKASIQLARVIEACNLLLTADEYPTS